jgi:Repeat of unknown function (DUF5648)
MLAALIGCLATSAAPAAEPVIEFYNTILNHYFITIDANEAGAIDQGSAGPGWHRTARVFGAYADAANAPSDAAPVCRFYGNVAQGGPNSHFYTIDPAECAAVKLDPGWMYEGIAFHARRPSAGACATGTAPVVRNYNQRFLQHDSNHRYTTDTSLYDEMAAIGWSAEGVVLCADAGIATPPRADPVVVSGLSTLMPGCERVNLPGILVENSEVEAWITVDPRAPDHFLGVFQQDRWSIGGAHGLIAAVSFDAGRSWQKTSAAFSRCTGGTPANGGDYWRASNPWVSFAPDGTAWQAGIAFGGGPRGIAGSSNVVASRSTDGGIHWDVPTVFIDDNSLHFNDKTAVTADPTDSRYVYVVWDRISDSDGPSWMARTADGGISWEPARIIYNPGVNRQTINNQIAVLPDGSLVDFFTELPIVGDDIPLMGIIRSTDKGLTWSPRIRIADMLGVGASNPLTGERIRDATILGQIAADRQGRLFAVWQDGRFTAGARDAAVIVTSADGGLTWTDPVRVSADPGVPAFEPAVAIARDGTIGVTYFDFRTAATDPATLPTDYWLARSTDGVHWSDTHVDGPFDYNLAPSVPSHFLGDYQGIATVGNSFALLYARTTAVDPANRTDIVSALIPPLAGTTTAMPSSRRAMNATAFEMSDQWAHRIRERVASVRNARRANGAGSAR